MDIELLRTFLEVARTRHFGKAADNLFLTQSAVSARIRQLEENVGVALFHRERNNIRPTDAGAKFVRYAEGIVNLWNRARQQVSADDGVQFALSVAGVPSLWDIFLQEWLQALHVGDSRMLLQVEVHSPDTQMRKLLDGTLDLGFVFDTPNAAGLRVREFARVPLVMVSTRPKLTINEALEDGYVLVDWGTSFASAHSRYFPGYGAPALRVGLGRIAHSLLLAVGGSAYLAEPTIARDVRAKRLFPVRDAPIIEREAYAVFSQAHDRLDIIEYALAVLTRPAGSHDLAQSS